MEECIITWNSEGMQKEITIYVPRSQAAAFEYFIWTVENEPKDVKPKTDWPGMTFDWEEVL
jgi:hypothetical protein